tara:strand:+ start:1012 stop:2571 length:1560 start_codon:yes stop_codon:yes gene_type:complete
MVTMPHTVVKKNNNEVKKISLIKDFDKNKNVFSQAVSNLDESGIQLAKDIITPFLSPVQTAKDLGSLGSSLINLIKPGEQGNEQLAREVGKFFKDRYGGLENIKKTFATDPLGMLSDVSVLFTGGGSLVAKTGQLTKLGALEKVGNVAKNVGKVDPINAVTSGSSLILNKGIPKAIEVIGGVPSDATKLAFQSGKQSGIISKNKSSQSFLDSMRGKDTPMKIVDDANEVFSDLQKSKRKNYRADMENLKLSTKNADGNKVLDFISDFEKSKLDDTGKVSEFAGENLKVLNEVKEEIVKFTSELGGDLTKVNGQQLDILKKRINSLYPSGANLGLSQDLVKSTTQNIANQIDNVAPGYSKASADYAAAIVLERQLIEELSIGKTKNASTTLKKLQSVMQNNRTTNFGSRLKALEKLDSVTELFNKKNILPRLAGQELSSIQGRGFGGGIQKGALLSSLFNPKALGISAIASPRLIGEGAYYTGKTLGKIPVTGLLQGSRLSGEIQRQPNIQGLLGRGLLQ